MPPQIANARIANARNANVAPLVQEKKISTAEFLNAIKMLAQSIVRHQNLHLK